MRPQFTIANLLLLMVATALALAWGITRSDLLASQEGHRQAREYAKLMERRWTYEQDRARTCRNQINHILGFIPESDYPKGPAVKQFSAIPDTKIHKCITCHERPTQ